MSLESALFIAVQLPTTIVAEWLVERGADLSERPTGKALAAVAIFPFVRKWIKKLLGARANEKMSR